MFYLEGCVCYSWLQVSLPNGVTWTWRILYRPVIVFSPFQFSSHFSASVHTKHFKDNTCILCLHTFCGRRWNVVFGLKCSPLYGWQGFSTVRCECRWVISTLWMPISFSVNSALRMWMQRHVQGYVCMRDCPPCCKYTCKIEAVCESVSVGALYFLHWASWLQSKQHELVKGSSVEGNQVLEQC